MITSRIEVETAIVQHLETRGSCTMEALAHSLPPFTFNQVFLAMDRLSRERKVSLRRPTRFTYLVSAAGSDTGNRSASQPIDRECIVREGASIR
jgi:hypothetical protein